MGIISLFWHKYLKSDRLLVIWKSDLTDKMKHVDTAIWMHYMDTD